MARRACATEAEESSVIFTAMFAAQYRATICDDVGSDACIMDAATQKNIEEKGGKVEIQDLNRNQDFCMAESKEDGTPAVLKCTRVATMDTELHVLHESVLELLNLRWLLTDRTVGEPLLRRPVLETLGLDCRQILAAAADRSSGAYDEVDIPLVSGGGFLRASSLTEGVLHADGGESNSDGEDTPEWLDLGPELPAEREEALKFKLTEADKEGISKEGRTELQQLLQEYKDVVKVRLGPGPPADVPPMNVRLPQGAPLVRAKKKWNPQEKCRFLDLYVEGFEKMGFCGRHMCPNGLRHRSLCPRSSRHATGWSWTTGL